MIKNTCKGTACIPDRHMIVQNLDKIKSRVSTVHSSRLGVGKVLKVHPGAMCMWIWSFDSFSCVVYLLFLLWYVHCFQLSVHPILVCCALTYDNCVLFIYYHRGSYL